MINIGTILANFLRTDKEPSEQELRELERILNNMQANNFAPRNWPSIPGTIDFNDIDSVEFDNTNPEALGSVAPGTTTVAARRDHVHPLQEIETQEAFPVGSVFIAVVSTNPGTLLGYGTWSAFGAGKVLVGIDSGDAAFDTVEETGGAKTHTLTVSELPSHTHQVNVRDDFVDGGGSSGGGVDAWRRNTMQESDLIQATGSGNAHNNLQPYIVVYMWKRTA